MAIDPNTEDIEREKARKYYESRVVATSGKRRPVKEDLETHKAIRQSMRSVMSNTHGRGFDKTKLKNALIHLTSHSPKTLKKPSDQADHSYVVSTAFKHAKRYLSPTEVNKILSAAAKKGWKLRHQHGESIKTESPELHNYKIEIHAVTMNPNYDIKKLAADFKEFTEKRFESFIYKTYVTIRDPKGKSASTH